MGIFGTKQEKIAAAVRMGERDSITCSSIWQQRIDGQKNKAIRNGSANTVRETAPAENEAFSLKYR
ncbi:MAG TPA: hypothetical protein PKJ77_10675, partial [Thermodesulfobacteriota bacterium]|nr:hypothetical protein [Thermodesulfobacteriota bacterium]